MSFVRAIGLGGLRGCLFGLFWPVADISLQHGVLEVLGLNY
jgi:hypothetical protein